jgi:thiamine-phosphate pyrophosphorylase
LSGGSGDSGAMRSCLLQQARHAVDAGIDYLQVRERDLEAAALADIVQELVSVARGSATRVLVNDRLDVALACGAAGVHLRGDSIPAPAVRQLVPDGFVVGVSVHTVAEAVAAAASADYLVAGTVWPTDSKPSAQTEALLGIEGLARIASAVTVPVLGIGGVTIDRVAAAARAGAAGAAAIGLFMSASAGRIGCRACPLAEVVKSARSRFDTLRSGS